jgi:hypothetical protein
MPSYGSERSAQFGRQHDIIQAVNTASPALIAHLLRQRGLRQEDLAHEMRTSQPTVSRLLSARVNIDDEDYVDYAPTLALGRRGDGETQPRWIVTRWHASGQIEDPPLTADGDLCIFSSFVIARAVADYLRLFKNGSAVAIPVWSSYVDEQAEDRSIPPEGVRDMDLGTDDDLEELDHVLRRLQRGFAMQAPPLAAYA